MSEPFEDQNEYLGALLELVSCRLNVVTQEPYRDPRSAEDPWREAKLRSELFRERCQRTLEQGTALPLEYLFSAFHCSPFEQHCIFLALAAELDARYEDYYASVQGGKSTRPLLELCLRTYTPDLREQLAETRCWQERAERLKYLFDPDDGKEHGYLSTPLRLNRRITQFVLDYSQPDPLLNTMIEESWAEEAELREMVVHREKLEQLLRFSIRLKPGVPVLCLVTGKKGAGRRTLIRHFCRELDMPVLTVDLNILTKRPESWSEQLIMVLREARLRGAALALLGTELLLREEPMADESEPSDRRETIWQGRTHLHYLLREAGEMTGLLFLISEEPWRPEVDTAGWQRAEVELNTPDAAQRLELWKFFTEQLPLDEGASLDALANKFALEPGQIAAAAAEAQRLREWTGSEKLTSEILHRACRSQLPHNLSKMAGRVNTSYTWDDLILPPMQKKRLQEACDQVEFRRKVYEEWGFGNKVAYGRGVSMLFSGPPGTGKTMAAQVIANRLRLELYKVDLSGVMSKYVGETEKQLGQVFDEVKKSQSILFFDEADALFGKRSETKDSHDRYANVQTSYLLQKIEEYDGIVILASNFLQNFDEAFKRRIKFIIDFTLPDRERREQVWRSVMPPELPRSEDVDFDFLARNLELSGSSIKNITVAAAFLAASDGLPMNMAHLLTAAQAEQQKAGKSMGREEFGEYYQLVEAYRLTELDQK